MTLGYARISTRAQLSNTSLDAQRTALLAAGCEKLYEDAHTGAELARPQFSLMCAEARPGDTIVVTRLDRIARTETEAYDLVNGWVRSGIRVQVLNLGTIEDTEIGRLILHIMLAFAEFERDLIISRTQGGRARRRATDPGYKEGRKPKFTRAQLDHAMELLGEHSFTRVAELTGMSRSTVTREARRRGIRKGRQ